MKINTDQRLLVHSLHNYGEDWTRIFCRTDSGLGNVFSVGFWFLSLNPNEISLLLKTVSMVGTLTCGPIRWANPPNHEQSVFVMETRSRSRRICHHHYQELWIALAYCKSY